MENKKADIAVTILVLGVIALCALTLVSFNLAGNRQIKGVVKSAYFLEDVYAIADSISYSGAFYLDKYKTEFKDYGISGDENQIKIEKIYYKKNLGLAWGGNDEVVKVRYGFKP